MKVCVFLPFTKSPPLPRSTGIGVFFHSARHYRKRARSPVRIDFASVCHADNQRASHGKRVALPDPFRIIARRHNDIVGTGLAIQIRQSSRDCHVPAPKIWPISPQRALWGFSPEFQQDGRPSGEKAKEMIATVVREGMLYF